MIIHNKDSYRVPSLNGRIIKDEHGIQTVETDSRDTGKRFISCLGFTRIPKVKLGDYVKLFYRVNEKGGFWYGRGK